MNLNHLPITSYRAGHKVADNKRAFLNIFTKAIGPQIPSLCEERYDNSVALTCFWGKKTIRWAGFILILRSFRSKNSNPQPKDRTTEKRNEDVIWNQRISSLTKKTIGKRQKTLPNHKAKGNAQDTKDQIKPTKALGNRWSIKVSLSTFTISKLSKIREDHPNSKSRQTNRLQFQCFQFQFTGNADPTSHHGPQFSR